MGGWEHDPAIVLLGLRWIGFQPFGGPVGPGRDLISPEGIAAGVTITAVMGAAGTNIDTGLGPFGYAEFRACRCTGPGVFGVSGGGW